jgi:BirA family biotin operon repressor/biotin-[acetyl-CoA-carboxylase] ligase
MKLSREDVLAGLSAERFGRSLYLLETVGSTNAAARELAEQGAPEGTTVLAEHQTAGRGRQGRSWTDIPGENILCSVVLRPRIPSSRIPLLTFAVSVAAAEAVERATGLRPSCKWPNDLLLRDRKFCGILLESASAGLRSGFAVAGIGINVNQRAFPDDISARATSLAAEAGTPVDRAALVRALLESLETWYDRVKQGDLSPALERWRSLTSMFGQKVSVTAGQETVSGIALRLADDGGLVIKSGSMLRTVYAGDVTLSAPGT